MSIIKLHEPMNRRTRMLSLLVAGISAISIVLMTKTDTVAQQSGNLFSPVSPERVAALPEDAQRQADTVIRRRYVTFNFNYFRSQVLRKRRVARRVVVKLFDDTRVHLDSVSVQRKPNGIYLLESKIKARFWGQALITLSKQTAMGTIQIDAKVYEISPVHDNIVSISEIDQRKFPNEAPPITRPGRQRTGVEKPTSSSPSIDSAAGTTISVLFVLPLQTNMLLCSSPALKDAFTNAYVQNLNSVFSFFPTGVTATGNTVCLSYNPQGGDLLADLNWVSTDNSVAAARDQFNSDLVTLIPDSGKFCGLAFYNEPPVTSDDAASAFSVVISGCALSNFSLAHEIGHNMGMLHDRIAENAQNSPDCNFGYIAPDNKYRTIMSYPPAYGYCPRVGTYSSKDVISIWPLKIPYGVPCDAPPDSNGNYSRADNLTQFITAAPVVSGFR